MPITAKMTTSTATVVAIPDLVLATLSGDSPHDGYGNPGRGVTNQLRLELRRKAENTLIPSGFQQITNANGDAATITNLEVEFKDPEGRIQHTIKVMNGVMSDWWIEWAMNGAAVEVWSITCLEANYAVDGANKTFKVK